MSAVYSSHQGPHRRPNDRHNPSFNHNRRSWTDHGAHYTVETASYATPGLSFGAVGGSARATFDGFPAPQRSRPQSSLTVSGALLGTALNLLGDLAPTPRVGGRRQANVEEAYSDDEQGDEQYDSDLAFEPTQHSHSNVFSRVKGKLLHNLEGKQRTRRTPHGRDTLPGQSSMASDPQRPYHTEERVPIVEDVEDDMPRGRFDERYQRPHSSRPSNSEYNDVVAPLEESVKYYKAEVKRCKKQIERASRAPQVDSNYLQSLLNELKSSETSLGSAMSSLQLAKDNLRSGKSPRNSSHHSPPLQHRQSTSTIHADFRGPFFGGPFGPFFSIPPPLDPFGRVDHMHDHIFGAFHHHFAAVPSFTPLHEDLPAFFAVPGYVFTDSRSERTRFGDARTGGTRGRQEPTYATFAPPLRSPPPNLMTPDEAKRLYKLYNDRWNASSTDPDIPYPSRGLRPDALLARDALWAPNVRAHPSTWSDETAMKANAQEFFLNVVGLAPKYSEALGSGAVEMGFDKAKVSDAQVGQLVAMLKKEKIRWHSDRLGRRNGGAGGPNEALQKDPRARAVFHAVCELMQEAQ